MTDVILWTAALLSVAGAFLGNRAAWALLASFAIANTAAFFGADFDLWLWVSLDCAVAAWIIFRPKSWTDALIVALFPVAWAGYFAPDLWRYWISWSIVVAQFLFTVPWVRLTQRARRTAPIDPLRGLDLFRVQEKMG